MYTHAHELCIRDEFNQVICLFDKFVLGLKRSETTAEHPFASQKAPKMTTLMLAFYCSDM